MTAAQRPGTADEARRTTCFVFPDPSGVLRARYTPSTFDRDGRLPLFSEYLFAIDERDRLITPSPHAPAHWPTWATGFRDLPMTMAAGDPRPLAWRPGQQAMFVEIQPDASELAAVSPRQVLAEAVERLATQGVTAMVGVELEFVLDEQTPSGDPVKAAYGMQLLPHEEAFFDDVCGALLASDIGVESWYREGGAGQWEIALAPRTPVEAADSTALARLAVSEIAAKTGLRANFAPVFGQDFGSGLHLHLSLHDSRGRNLLHGIASSGGGFELVERKGASALAGILAHLREITAILAPSPSSYQRFEPHTAAGTSATWASESRAAGIRHLERADNSRVEVRVAAGDADPYLALATIVLSAADGLAGRRQLPAATSGDVYLEATLEQQLPSTLIEAASELRNSSFLRAEAGDLFVDFFADRALWRASCEP